MTDRPRVPARPAPRSYLYVPGDQAEKLDRVLTRGADAVIIDLEDAVRPADRRRARALVRDWLANKMGREVPNGEIWVRINPGREGVDDIDAVVSPGLAGVCVAKVGSADDLKVLNDHLERAERQRGLVPGGTRVQPMVETAKGLMAASAIASSPRVERVQLGELDLVAELGIHPSLDAREVLFARSVVVTASAAASIEPPIGPVDRDFSALERFRESTEQVKRLGFGSRACIHPDQVAVVNEVFTPSTSELTWALDVLQADEAASLAGSGTGLDSAGMMVDEAVVRRARRILGRAERARPSG